MKKSTIKISFHFILFFLFTSICTGAVFQEPVAENPNTFKSRFLFSEGFKVSTDTEIETPEYTKEKPIKSSYNNIFNQKPVIEKTFSPESGRPLVKARYIRPSLHSVHSIMEKYKSIPGGVTLEGTGKGLSKIQSAIFDKTENVFIINKNIRYTSPVSSSEMKYILHAINTDNRMGVSLGDPGVVYGSLTSGSIPCINLKLTDHFLGCIVFANNKWIRNYDFPDNYRPRKLIHSGGGYAVYFNLEDFNFIKDGDTIVPTESTLTITLIPLTDKKGPEGGYLPDFDRIAKGKIPGEFESNISHIVKNVGFYQNDVRLSKANAYGEAAAFARTLQANEISLETLINSM
ncbi:MAG: hypothetical protein P9M03_10960 [Candidatus Theseobacter exili]|nr:hypothetical protein [Candidatus Theseobacter exili]